MKVKIKKIDDRAIIPTKAHLGDAGFDLCACIKKGRDYIKIEPHKTSLIPTGLSIEIPKGYFGGIFARSGLATKSGLRPANCVGVCDESYRGEYKVALHNDTDTDRYVENGDRIAQLIVLPYLDFDFEEVTELSNTDRGDGGFGSSGK